MKHNTILTTAALCFSLSFLAACGGNTAGRQAADQTSVTEQKEDASLLQPKVDLVKDEDIKLGSALDQALVTEGEKTYQLKCQSCHKLTGEKLVGPGWEGITKRRTPAWIVNMITNTDAMLESDPEAQKLLEQCLVRMPNQNISQEDAREVLEFMRSNDGNK